MYEKIRRLCESREISISELETKLGFSRGSIYKWDSSVPGVVKVKAVADYFGVKIEDLME